MSLHGPKLPRRLSAFVSAIEGLAAAPAVLSARQLIRKVSYSHCVLHRVQPKPFRFRARSMWRRTFFSTQSLMKLKHSQECPTAK